MQKIFLLVSTVFYTNEREVFLIQRNNEPYKKYWGLVGGKIEYGEKIYDANQRELEEEIGYIEPFLEYYGKFEFFDIGHAIVFVYKKLIGDKNLFLNRLTLGENEIIDGNWFKISELQKLQLFPNHILVINKCCNEFNMRDT